MAIYGVGSKWDEDEEVKEKFFSKNKFILGWDYKHAKDIYIFISQLKVGDILYIKSSGAGSRDIHVKGIGIVKKNVLSCIIDGKYQKSDIKDWNSLFVDVQWILQEDFSITIPKSEGKLTNYRAATVYEEYLPCVQKEILSKIFENINVK
jgi:hypothetical protein